MSHELRTPLNAIIGFSEIMESGMFGPLGAEKYHEYCRDIHDSGQYLLDVINDILDMSKIEAGRIRLDFEDLALDPLLAEAMRVVSARAQEKQLELVARISPELRLRADRRALKQIVLNLLSNAVKFTPEGGSVTVRARAADHCIVLAIADTGIGIAKDALASSAGRSSRWKASSPRAIRARGWASPSPSRWPNCMAAPCASARPSAGARWWWCGCRWSRIARCRRRKRRDALAVRANVDCENAGLFRANFRVVRTSGAAAPPVRQVHLKLFIFQNNYGCGRHLPIAAAQSGSTRQM